MLNRGCDASKFGGTNGFFGITPKAFGTVGAMVNLTVACFVSKLSGEAPAHFQRMVEEIRVPKGSGAATRGHA